MDGLESKEKKLSRVNIRLHPEIYKAMRYAKIEAGCSNERLIGDILKAHFLKIGLLKESGDVTKPDSVVLNNAEE